MRFLSATLLLAFAFALPTAAHADTLDDFVLTGNGHTYTFSLPSSGLAAGDSTFGITTRDFLYQTAASATVDGAAGYTVTAVFFFYSGYVGGHATEGIDIDQPGSDVGALSAALIGAPASVGYSVIPNEPLMGPYLGFHIPGTYDRFTETYNQGYIDTPYTLTITPEATSSPIPEPSTLALLGTGSLALLSRLRRSVRR